jgi:hypothetical protein
MTTAASRPSSVFARALPVRAGLVSLLAIAVLAGCGGDDDERSAVRDYVDEANAILRERADEFKRANETYAVFAGGEPAADSAATLGQAESDIRAARARLVELRPPRDARRLHSELVRLFELNIDFARQTTLLAAYQDGAGEALARLERYEEGLSTELAGADAPAAQADALRRFADRLALTERRLRELEAPRVLLLRRRQQLLRLESTRELADDLRAALEARDGEQVAQLLDRFREHGRADSPGRTLDRRTIARYRRSYRRLGDAYADLTREHARLERTLD